MNYNTIKISQPKILKNFYCKNKYHAEKLKTKYSFTGLIKKSKKQH